jgi:hypothetical protein
VITILFGLLLHFFFDYIVFVLWLLLSAESYLLEAFRLFLLTLPCLLYVLLDLLVRLRSLEREVSRDGIFDYRYIFDLLESVETLKVLKTVWHRHLRPS